jgi:hypothetical protein
MNLRKQRALERLFKRARKHLTKTNCMACDYDEAEGFLIDHCRECSHKIVCELWKAFIASSDAMAVTAKKRAFP